MGSKLTIKWICLVISLWRIRVLSLPVKMGNKILRIVPVLMLNLWTRILTVMDSCVILVRMISAILMMLVMCACLVLHVVKQRSRLYSHQVHLLLFLVRGVGQWLQSSTVSLSSSLLHLLIIATLSFLVIHLSYSVGESACQENSGAVGDLSWSVYQGSTLYIWSSLFLVYLNNNLHISFLDISLAALVKKHAIIILDRSLMKRGE